jgi:hypothetical protein
MKKCDRRRKRRGRSRRRNEEKRGGTCARDAGRQRPPQPAQGRRSVALRQLLRLHPSDSLGTILLGTQRGEARVFAAAWERGWQSAAVEREGLSLPRSLTPTERLEQADEAVANAPH